MKEMHLTKKDFRVDWFSGTGAGGQYRNRHRNCCRITHIESGLSATGQSHRDRPSNQREAFQRLAQLLLAHAADPEPERRTSGERVRTYHEPRNTVIDHASGFTSSYKDTVEKRGLGEHIRRRHAAMEMVW